MAQGATISVTTTDGSGIDEAILYYRGESDGGRSAYYGQNHDFQNREMLHLYRTRPRPSGNHNGTARCRLKFTHDLDVEGAVSEETVTRQMIADLNFGFPVGATAGDIEKILRQMASLLGNSTVMDKITSAAQEV